MKSIFISRKLKEDSPIKELCEQQGISYTNYSFLKFEGLPFNFTNDYNWLFFYSANGVKFFFEGFQETLNLTTKIACFGPGTALYLEKNYEVNADFIGQGLAFQIIREFEKELHTNDKIAFVRAKNSLQSVQKLLTDDRKADDLVVYDNIRNTSIKAPNADIIILTSPLNAKAFFEISNINNNQILVAIGSTTKKEIQKWTNQPILTPLMPNEKILSKLLLKII